MFRKKNKKKQVPTEDDEEPMMAEEDEQRQYDEEPIMVEEEEQPVQEQPVEEQPVQEEEEEKEPKEEESLEEGESLEEYEVEIGSEVDDAEINPAEDSTEDVEDVDLEDTNGHVSNGHSMESNGVEAQSAGESPESPTPAPPPFRPISDKFRTNLHSQLRQFESQRRSSYTSKLESSSLYWRSFRDLLQASVQETARAERIILGTAKAHRAYSESMRASYDDVFVDDKGSVVTDPKKQKKLQEQRAAAKNTKDGSIQTKASSAEEKREGMLASMVDSQLFLAERFGENATHLESELVSEIASLRTQLKTKVDGIQGLGDAILNELEKTEAEVAKAWETYFKIASKSMSGTGSESPVAGATETDQCNDVWVVEMQYRVAVSYQSTAWESASSALSTLFASMKDTECQRRMELREFLVAFLQRQERLFASIPDILTPVLKDLIGRDMDRNAIEEKVSAAIRKRAEVLQREELETKPPTTTGSGLATNPDKPKEDVSGFKLESPLLSELICKAKVVDRRKGGAMSSWKTTLAIVTADSFLHLFDLPPNAPISAGTAPEVAFQALVPRVQVPTADNIKSGKTNFVKDWCSLLTPSDSFLLTNCSITTGLNDPNGSAFEVVERIVASGASKMFGKTSTKKIMLRTVTSKESEDWIAAMKAQRWDEQKA